MKRLFSLQILIFLHLILMEMNAQTGWYQQISGTNQGLYGIYFSDVNTGTAVGTFGTILRTTDRGTTWAAQNSGTSNFHFFDVHFIDANVGTIVGIAGAILRTTDGGQNWTSQTSGVITALQSVFFTDVNNGVAVGHTGTMLRTTDGGTNWIQQPNAPTSLRSVHFTDMSNGITVGDNGLIMRTSDGGVSWIQQPSGIQVNLHGVWLTDINTGTVVGGNNLTGARIYRTTDSGLSWALQHSISNEALSDVCFTDSQTGTAVGWSGIILRTTNGGETWVSQNANTEFALASVFFVNTDIGFVVGSGGTILATIDGGIPVELNSFTATANLGNVTLNWSTATETNNRGFEILRSSGKAEWEVIGFVEGKGTTSEVQRYSYTDENLNPGSYLYRLKQIDFDGSFEYSFIVEAEVRTPDEFYLSQNYPNPFNPVTVISWQSPVGSWQTLKVFDLLGNDVATLVDEYKNAGSYEVEFESSRLSSGIYCYQLKIDSFVETKKMVLMK